MDNLNFPSYNYRVRNHGQSKQIFDSIRKKYVALTPEEWVRQHMISFLINEKNYPSALIAVEMPLMLNKLRKRADIVAYNRNGTPLVLVECKAPAVQVSQTSFDQAARYCLATGIKLIIITNGLSHYCAEIDNEKQAYHFLEDIPFFTDPDRLNSL
ncbi:MAG: type I restriction enzyme HsdR N-terminal domain-containing protein [Bacteroidia bacterium]